MLLKRESIVGDTQSIKKPHKSSLNVISHLKSHKINNLKRMIVKKFP